MIEYVGDLMARGKVPDCAEKVVRTESGSEIARLTSRLFS
jgi:hypothetical protein